MPYYPVYDKEYADFLESNEYKEYLQQIQDYKNEYYIFLNNSKSNEDWQN